jgi:hypothetical protein
METVKEENNNNRLWAFKTGIDPDKMTDERKEKGLSIRKEKREKKLARKRGTGVTNSEVDNVFKSMNLADALKMAVGNIFKDTFDDVSFGLGHLEYIMANENYDILVIQNMLFDHVPTLMKRLNWVLNKNTNEQTLRCVEFAICIIYMLVNTHMERDKMQVYAEKMFVENVFETLLGHIKKGSEKIRDLCVITFICAMEASRSVCERILLQYGDTLWSFFESPHGQTPEMTNRLCWYMYVVTYHRSPPIPFSHVDLPIKRVLKTIQSKSVSIHALGALYNLRGRGGKDSPVFMQMCEPLFRDLCHLCAPIRDPQNSEYRNENDLGFKVLQILHLIFSNMELMGPKTLTQCVMAFARDMNGVGKIQAWLTLPERDYPLARIECVEILYYVICTNEFAAIFEIVRLNLVENICCAEIISEAENNGRLLIFSNILRFLLPHEFMNEKIFYKLFESGRLINYLCTRLTFPNPSIVVDVLQNLLLCLDYDIRLAKATHVNIGMVTDQMDQNDAFTTIQTIANDHDDKTVLYAANAIIKLYDKLISPLMDLNN